MFQVRIHGRGGQGVVSGAEMLSVAAFLCGKHAQAFPSFGSERTGAPVVGSTRTRSSERPARPYICRFRNFSRVDFVTAVIARQYPCEKAK